MALVARLVIVDEDGGVGDGGAGGVGNGAGDGAADDLRGSELHSQAEDQNHSNQFAYHGSLLYAVHPRSPSMGMAPNRMMHSV